MGRIFCFISLCFSSAAFGAEGLAGTSAAIGIANTLQNKAQVNPQKAIDASKQAVKQYQNKLNSQAQPPLPQNIQANQDTELILKPKKGAAQNTSITSSLPKSYKSQSVVFYKNDCNLKDKNCKRGAMLVNIKSVMFDYEQGRMKFKK